jgi:hypothetical protein
MAPAPARLYAHFAQNDVSLPLRQAHEMALQLLPFVLSTERLRPSQSTLAVGSSRLLMSAYATGSQESVITVPEDAWLRQRQHAQRNLFMAAIDPFHCDRDAPMDSSLRQQFELIHRTLNHC